MRRRSFNVLVVASVFFLLGMVLFFSLSKSGESVTALDPIKYQVSHPFSIESTNLLATPSDVDKRKSRLNKYDIAYALDEVLLSEGLKNEPSAIHNYNINIPVTAYDSESGIGYTLIDYDRLGAGLWTDKLGEGRTLEQCKLDFLKMIDQGIELYFDDNEKFLDEVFGKENVGHVDDEPSYEEIRSAAWAKFQENIDSGKNNRTAFQEYNVTMSEVSHLFVPYTRLIKDWTYFGDKIKPKNDIVSSYGAEVRAQLMSFGTYGDQRDYLEILLPEVRKKLEVDYLSTKKNKTMFDEWKLSAASMIEEPDRFFGLVSMIDNMRIYSPTPELSTALNAQIFEIIVESDRKMWWKRSHAIFDLFNANENPGLFSKESYKSLLTDILTNGKFNKWKNRYHEINAIGDDENISLSELKSLDALAVQKGIYIAPISILDDRMIYDMEEEKYLDTLAAVRQQITDARSKVERKKLQEQLMGLSQDRSENYNQIRSRAKAKSMSKLKEDMCTYIEWAKNQSVKVHDSV